MVNDQNSDMDKSVKSKRSQAKQQDARKSNVAAAAAQDK